MTTLISGETTVVEDASVGLDAIHPLSRTVRRLAADLIQDKNVLDLFHTPWISPLRRPMGVPAELWEIMTDEHKELITYRVLSDTLQKGLMRSEKV